MKFLSIVFLALFLTGCYSTGTDIDAAKINQFVKGETTESEVVALFGYPATVSTSANGEKQIVYMHSNTDVDASTYIPVVGLFTGGATSTSKYLIVTLDDAGVVKDWTVSETVVSTN